MRRFRDAGGSHGYPAVSGWRACWGPRAGAGCSSGGDLEELLEVLAGDEPASADFDGGEVAAAHLVIEQVAGQAGQAGGFVDGVGQPFGGWVWSWLAGPGGCRAGVVAGIRVPGSGGPGWRA